MNLRRFSSTQELIGGAAEFCLSHLRNRSTPVPFLVALSGGRTAEPLFEALVRSNTPGLFTNVHFFWADERCVPPTDSASNFGQAHRHLLAPLAVAPSHIHRIEGEISPPQAAGQAEISLRTVTGAPPGSIPTLDLVLLGMGEDGHVASLFPGIGEPVGRLFYEVIAPKPPPRRITMSYSLLREARVVLAIVSGSPKAEALRRSVEVGDTPLGRLIRSRKQLDVWVDFAH